MRLAPAVKGEPAHIIQLPRSRIRSRTSRPTCIFPLRLRRQRPAHPLLRIARIERLQELLAVLPRNVLYGQVTPLEPGRIAAHHARPLLLRHFVLSHPEPFRQRHQMLLLVLPPPRLLPLLEKTFSGRALHRETPGRTPHQLHLCSTRQRDCLHLTNFPRVSVPHTHFGSLLPTFPLPLPFRFFFPAALPV